MNNTTHNQQLFFDKAREVKTDAIAENKNPIGRRLAEAFAFSIKEFDGTPLLISTVIPNPVAEAESKR